MSVPVPLEAQLLSAANQALGRVGSTPESRYEVLEGAASRLGGFALGEYRARFGENWVLTDRAALDASSELVGALKGCVIPPPLALCALSRPLISVPQQRVSGAYYTDFRLAGHVAAGAAPRLVEGARVIDPAAGTGTLLVAASLAACGVNRVKRAAWLAESVTAWDLSPAALRGARLALASLTHDLSAVEAMVSRWRVHDSLLVEDAPWGRFDVVLGNPPWEKIKLTRHEFVKANGGARHYGDDYGELDRGLFASQRGAVARYGAKLASRFPLLGRGEPDLYRAFLELFLKLVRPGGCVSVLVPAGLIRSQGTEGLRRFLFDNTSQLAFTIFENRARFFGIDTRFKFLGVVLTKAAAVSPLQAVFVAHAKGTPCGVMAHGQVRLSRNVLARIQPRLAIPEVRSREEWRLFSRMSAKAAPPPDEMSPWKAEIVREVDMTRDRSAFSRSPAEGTVPVIEGRMVHQHRFGAKAYRQGTGRRARWETVPVGAREVGPQFWCSKARLTSQGSKRISLDRAGFCDITGQTNERSMLASLIPPGVVCGNKVPTVTFPNDLSVERLCLWVAIVNSIPFDWALRRLLTTTVNYFLLSSVPFPRLHPGLLLGRSIVEATQELGCLPCGLESGGPWRAAQLRASIDVSVLEAYGLGFDDLELMLRDFPLLDRGQPPLAGEKRSTVTRDFVLVHAGTRFAEDATFYLRRLSLARRAGAVPYVPSEFATALVGRGTEVDHG